MLTLDFFDDYIAVRNRMDTILVNERSSTLNLYTAVDAPAKEWRRLAFLAQQMENQAFCCADFLINEEETGDKKAVS